MRGVVPFARIGFAACVASCATTLGGDARSTDRLSIAPYDAHDECFDLRVGDRLDYRFESSAPIDFELRYREANVVVSPTARPRSTGDSAIFEVRVPARYCLDWQAGADAVTLGYRLSVHRAPR